jgi:DHA2 family methylenomycin A resistance protein-like MFS transporter
MNDLTINSTKRWLIVIGAGIMIMLANLDMTIVNLAIPTMNHYFHSQLSVMQWVITLYFLGAVVSFVTSGHLADYYGRKPVFLVGTLLFTVSSLVIDLTSNLHMVFAMRFIQGAGFAATLSLAIAMIRSVFPVEKHGLAIGIAITTTGVSQAIGPTVGGLLLAIASWHFLFLLNVPLCFVSLVLISLFYKEAKPERTALKPWHNLINLSVFKIKKYNYTFVLRMLFMMVWSGVLFVLPVYMQNTLHYSTVTSGLYLLTMTIFIGIGAPITGKLIDRYGADRLIIIAMGLAFMSAIMFLVDMVELNNLFMLIGLALLGISTALMLPSSIFTAMKSLPAKISGKGMGIYFTLAFIGSSVGVYFASHLQAGMPIGNHGLIALFLIDIVVGFVMLLGALKSYRVKFSG